MSTKVLKKLSFGPYTIDFGAHRLLRGREPVELNGKAFDLLGIFVQNPGQALSREDLYERLWPDTVVEDSNLSQNVYIVRRALQSNGDDREYIETIPRFGYRFCSDVAPPKARASLAWLTVASGTAIAALAVLILAVTTSSATSRATMPAAARESFALARYHLHLRTPNDLTFARGYFEQTVRLAPRDPAGYAGLASVYALLAEYYNDGSSESRHDIQIAKRYRDAALLRDPKNSDALAASGFMSYRFDGNAAQAGQYLAAALAADANNADAHHWQGVLLLVEGKTTEAVAEFETAHRLEPTSEVFLRWLARGYEFARRSRDALAMSTAALRIQPRDEGALLVRAVAQEENGDLRAALATLRIVGRNPWERQFVLPDEARLEAQLHRANLAALVARVDAASARGELDPFETALFYYAIGQKGRANAAFHSIAPSFVNLGLARNDPRYRGPIVKQALSSD